MNETVTLTIGIITIFLIFVTFNNLARVENFKPDSNINKTYFETYLDYNKKVYEYVYNKKIPDNEKLTNPTPITLSKYYDNIKSNIKELLTNKNCGYIYNYYEDESSAPGSMYSTDSGLALTYEDLNKNNGLYTMLENSKTIVIYDGDISHQIIKQEINMDPITGVITIDIGDKLKMFKTNTKYILYPCATLEHIDNTPPSNISSNPIGGDYSIKQSIVDSNVHRTLGIFFGAMILIVVIYNWAFLFEQVKKIFGFSEKSKGESTDSELNNIYYIGGYDYRDYSE